MKETPFYIITINYFCIAFILVGIYVAYSNSQSHLSAFLFFISWLYLIPPILARLTIMLLGRPSGTVGNTSKAHFTWWLLFQYQLIFNRFTVLEEMLRIIPGIYAIWLNLWGAHVSPFTFWSPGVTVLDRYNLRIDKGVILGTECLLSGHFLTVDEQGTYALVIGNIEIHANALIGARAMVAPGCIINKNEILSATRMMMPYTELKNGTKRKIKTNV